MLGLAMALCAPQLRAQTAGQSDSPTIIFGTVAADKGTVASIPVYVNSGGQRLRRVAVAMDFISNSVKFDKLDTSASSNSADTKVTVELQELSPDPKGLPRTRLKLVADAPNGFADGLLAFLNFKLAADAKPFAVSLQPAEISAEDAKGQPVKAVVEAGKVIVSADDEEVIGCFFFTH